METVFLHDASSFERNMHFQTKLRRIIRDNRCLSRLLLRKSSFFCSLVFVDAFVGWLPFHLNHRMDIEESFSSGLSTKCIRCSPCLWGTWLYFAGVSADFTLKMIAVSEKSQPVCSFSWASCSCLDLTRNGIEKTTKMWLQEPFWEWCCFVSRVSLIIIFVRNKLLQTAPSSLAFMISFCCTR